MIAELPTACPAAEPMLIRAAGGVPGVRCRIEHNDLAVTKDPRTISGFCCASPANPCAARRGSSLRSTSYVDCPSWEYDKLLIWMGQHSLGDERALEDAEERAWREDLTGSQYGDTSLMETVNAAVRESQEALREMADRGGGVIGWES